MTNLKLMQEISAGVKASEQLGVLSPALDALEASKMVAWASMTSVEDREAAFLYIKALRDIRSSFKKTIQTGELAKRQYKNEN